MLSSLSLFLPASRIHIFIYVYLPNLYNTFPFISRSRLVGSDGKIALCLVQVLDLHSVTSKAHVRRTHL